MTPIKSLVKRDDDWAIERMIFSTISPLGRDG
jgi:hypothetical protein